MFFGALPATTNYKLNSFSFGSGGTAKSQTATYSLEGVSGELSGSPAGTANATAKPGYIQAQQANVPKLSALDNNGGQYYNKLHFVIDAQGNPTDAKYLIAVSTDNFVSDIKYVQSDGTLSATLLTAHYQTYAAWGGASGSLIIGLQPSTNYAVKLRATQGQFTESAYGPVSNQATAAPSLTFNMTIASQSPPYSLPLGILTAGSVSTSSQTIDTTLSTNGTTGGNVYILGQNGGLKSTATGNQINAVSNNLAVLVNGFGAQSKPGSISVGAGGPYTAVAPYDGTGDTVGIIDGLSRSLYTSSTPITTAFASVQLKAKSATNDVAATDYQEVLTIVAAGNF